MPIITKYRTWCKTCVEWVCDKCGELHELYKFSEIPNEKLVEQRERYKETGFSHFKRLTGMTIVLAVN